MGEDTAAGVISGPEMLLFLPVKFSSVQLSTT